jgi:beta-lactamase superfamily II metal-dependent hydrolase
MGARRATKQLRIRMYNVGFGDAFLITYPHDGGERRVLVDCGSISAPKPRSIATAVGEILADSGPDGAKRIDVVIATHRHRDHVSGFSSALWETVDVGEVWMPWTEDPDDAEATRIRNRQGLVAEALHRSLAATPGSSHLAAIAMNALRNEDAMRTLHSGFKGNPKRRFLSAKKTGGPVEVTTAALPRVTAYVLGPSRAEEVIKDMDPPGAESYLRLAAARTGTGTDSEYLQPFAPSVRIGTDHGLRMHKGLSRADMKAIQTMADGADELMAAKIDGAVNGTSLLLVLQIGKAKLLLPGDAQWGTWKLALGSTESAALLDGANFLKVGHHGSHNASPKSYVEKHLKKGTLAMVSVKPVSNWKKIPRVPLLNRFKELHVPFVRSDGKTAAAPFVRNGSKWIDAMVPF